MRTDYRVQCLECGHEWDEIFRSLPPQCPRCKGFEVRTGSHFQAREEAGDDETDQR